MPVLTILGAVSGCAGLLAFLISTSERLVQVTYIAKDARSILQSYLNTFEALQDRIKAWERKWSSFHPEWLWGAQGAEAIQRQLQNTYDILEQTCTKVRVGVHARDHWTSTDSSQWTSYLDALKQEIDTAQPEVSPPRQEIRTQCSPGLLGRAALVLGKYKLLDEYSDRLRRCVTNLESRSRTLYNQAHAYRDWTTDRNAQDIEEARHQQMRVANIEAVMQTVFEGLVQQEAAGYAILMSPPNDFNRCCIVTVPELVRIDLLHHLSEPCVRLDCGKLSFTFSADRPPQVSASRSLATIRSVHALTTTCLSEDLKAGLIRMSTDAFSSNYADGTRLLRSKAALYLAVWSMHIWNTGWLHDLCSCGLRMAKGPPSTDAIPSFRKRFEHSHSAPCSGGNVGERHHLLMGVLLAELALMRPVYYLEDVAEKKHFRIREGTGRTVLVSREELKERIWDETISSSYPNAVDFCFTLDEIHFDEGPTPLQGSDLWRLWDENVVQPLFRYYQVVEEDSVSIRKHSSWAERWSFLWQTP